MKNVVRALVFASILSLTASSSYAEGPGGANPHPTGAYSTFSSVMSAIATVLGL
jgi:hypothetical protein